MSEAIRIPSSLHRRWPSLAVSPTTAYAIRLGIAAATAVWIGKAPGLVENSSTWILITVFMVLQPAPGGSLMKGLFRALGTAAAAFTSIGLFGLFAQDPPLLMAGFWTVQVVAAYGYTGPRFQYAWFVWAFTTAIVLGEAMAGQDAVETLAFQRASMVAIGILLVFVVDSLFWPVRAEPRLRESLAGRARQLGEALRWALSGSGERPGAASFADALGSTALSSQIPLVTAARMEVGVSRAGADMLVRVALLLETLASRARTLIERIEEPDGSDAAEGSSGAMRAELGRRLERALEEIATAVGTERAPQAFSDDLDRALLDLETGAAAPARRPDRSAVREGQASDLRDIAAVLRQFEAVLSPGDVEEVAVEAPSSGPGLRWRPDPFRVKVALRMGMAVVAAFLAVIVLGWPMNNLLAPLAFMVAALNRGAARQTLVSLATVLGLAWLVADLVIVFLTPHLGRMPLALGVAFVLPVACVYASVGRPLLAMLPSIGCLIAMLSVFGGPSAQTNVYGSYSTVCYVALAMGVGWAFSQLLWPATAARLFRQRVAIQLELCAEAVRRSRVEGDEARSGRAVELIRGCVQQSMQLHPLHGQACHEPVERALDEDRRSEILALATDLMDALVGERSDALETLPESGGASLGALRDALRQEDEALLTSMQLAVDALRDPSADPGPELASAHRSVEDRLAELRANPDAIPRISDEQQRRVLVALDSRRGVVSRQLAIERWLADWRRAEGLDRDGSELRGSRTAAAHGKP